VLHVTCVSSVCSVEADNCLDGPLPWTPLLLLFGDDSCFIRMIDVVFCGRVQQGRRVCIENPTLI